MGGPQQLDDVTREVLSQVDEIDDATVKYHVRQAAQRLMIAEQEFDK